MPKAMNYTKGSIIYFSGDKDERIFILQKGSIILTSIDLETNAPITEYIRQGEFFGVKSALGHFPREETATVVSESLVISLSVAEFEAMFSNNKQIIMKMLRVFSNQLRCLHRKTESVLNSLNEIGQEKGMLAVAQSFYDEESYKPCCDVCLKFLKRFPHSSLKEEVANLYTAAKKRFELQTSRKKPSHDDITTVNSDAALKQFSLPAFSRFAKNYDANTVIIAEFEPGDNFYLIQSGRVQLVKYVNGARKNLDILMPGEFFGEMAILENSPRSATCISIDPVEVLEFNKENFEILITGNPQIALVLLKLFCKRIYDQKRRLKTLVIHDTSARILDVFLMFDEMNPSPNMADRSRRFNLSIADLAHWAGLPQEIVREEISRFVEKRRIEIFDNYMIVANIIDIKRYVDSRAHQRH